MKQATINPTIHLTPPPKQFRSRRAASFHAPPWKIVPDASCPDCGAEIETNDWTRQCKNYGNCTYVFSVPLGRRIDT